jgi:hypothetical protein
MTELNITPHELNSLLLNHPPEIFCKIWRETEIYDYEEIKKFAINNKNLIPSLDISLYRVDIDGNNSNFTSESLAAELEQFKKESPQLKEINLSYLSIKDIDTLLSFPNIKSITNLRLDKIDSQTTHLIFERIIELYDQFGADFTFDVRHSFYYAKHGNREAAEVIDSEEDSEFENEDVYHIKYDHGTLLYDNINFDSKHGINGKFRHDKVSYLANVVQKLRPHTIETYGAEITTSLMACDSIKSIIFKDRIYGIDQEYDITFESLLYFNKEYMNTLYPDKKDEVQLIEDDSGNVMSEDDMREEGCIPKIVVNNCSVESILYTPLHLNRESYMEKDGEYDYIFPTIIKFTMPMEVCHLQDTMNTYPNVETLYYYPPTEEMILQKEYDLTSLINNNPNVNFVPYGE